MSSTTHHPYGILTFKHERSINPTLLGQNHADNASSTQMDCDDLIMYSGFPTSTAPSCDTSISGGSSVGAASDSSLSLLSSVDSSSNGGDDCGSDFHSPDMPDNATTNADVNNHKSNDNHASVTAALDAAAANVFATPVVHSVGSSSVDNNALNVSLDAECIFMTGSHDYHDHTGATIENLCNALDKTVVSPTSTTVQPSSVVVDPTSRRNAVANAQNTTNVNSTAVRQQPRRQQSNTSTDALHTAVARPAPAPPTTNNGRSVMHANGDALQRRPERSATVTSSSQLAADADDDCSPQMLGQNRFNVGTRYRVCDVIGEGAYGVVCSAVHRASGQKVAIKKIQPFEHQMFALRTLRELKLLRHFQELDVCENIISILDVVKAPTFEQFHEVYLIQELMETDLHRVVRSQKLSDDHAQYFIYQILRALKVMHSADVIHRDLKPSNLLLNANCDLKVCDFGLARSVLTAEPGGETGYMTEYVATRWYRAPEIMLTFKQYTKAIDIWSVGCVLAEMISGRPLFPGRDYHHQISLILDVLGTPSIDDWYAIGSRRSRDYIRQMPLRKRKDFAKLFPTATPDALDFLHKTLAFNPKKRPTVEECLAHPYLSAYHDPEDEPSINSLPPSYFSYDLQPRPSAEKLRQQMWDEIESLPRYI